MVVVYDDGLEEVEELVFCFYVILYGGELDEKECFGNLFYVVNGTYGGGLEEVKELVY